MEQVTARAVTVTAQAVTTGKPSPMPSPSEIAGQDGNGDGVTACNEYSLNLRKKENSHISSKRARAMSPRHRQCPFVPWEPCMDFCPNRVQQDGKCELLAAVPQGEQPREWYIRAMQEIASW